MPPQRQDSGVCREARPRAPLPAASPRAPARRFLPPGAKRTAPAGPSPYLCAPSRSGFLFHCGSRARAGAAPAASGPRPAAPDCRPRSPAPCRRAPSFPRARLRISGHLAQKPPRVCKHHPTRSGSRSPVPSARGFLVKNVLAAVSGRKESPRVRGRQSQGEVPRSVPEAQGSGQAQAGLRSPQSERRNGRCSVHY